MASALAASVLLVTAACGGGDDASDDGAAPSDGAAPWDTDGDEEPGDDDADEDAGSDDADEDAGSDGDSGQDDDSEADADAGDDEDAGSAGTRPETRLPDDVELVLDWETPDNPYQEQALQDSGAFLEAVHEAIEAQDPDHPTYQAYSEDSARDDARDVIDQWVNAGRTAEGVDRYYNATVTGHESGEIITSVDFCRDTSGLSARNADTGEPEGLPVDDHQTRYTLFVHNALDEDEVYRPKIIMDVAGSSECEE